MKTLKKYSPKLPMQMFDAIERAQMNDEEGYDAKADRFDVLSIKNKNTGLTKDEWDKYKELIALFNYRGWEWKQLNF